LGKYQGRLIHRKQEKKQVRKKSSIGAENILSIPCELWLRKIHQRGC